MKDKVRFVARLYDDDSEIRLFKIVVSSEGYLMGYEDLDGNVYGPHQIYLEVCNKVN